MEATDSLIEAKTKKQVKLGTVLSYLVLLVELLVNLLFFPWLAKSVGQGNYGLYTLASSTISIFLMDFGLSAAVSKFLSQYRAKNDKQGADNFLGLVYKLYLIIDIAIFVVVLACYFFLGVLKGLSGAELETFKMLYIVVGAYSVISFPLIPLNGTLGANEEYIFTKICTLLQKAVSVILMVLAVVFNFGIFGVVLANVTTSLLASIIKAIYIRTKIKVKPNFAYKDKAMFKSIFTFSIWISVLVIGQKILSNISSTVLGIVSSSNAIAIFGFALTLETYAYSISTVIGDMFLPKITRMMNKNEKDPALDKLFSFVGKIQMMVIGLVFIGFCLFGKEFSIMLMGPEYAESYICTILLIFPLLIQVPTQIMESQSYVSNTVKESAIIMICCSIVGLGLMFLFGKFWGATGVCIAICLAQTVFSILRTVFVYKRKQHVDIKSFLKKVYVRYLPSCLLCVGLGVVLVLLNKVTSWKPFILDVIIVSLFYCLAVWLLYFTEDEKNRIWSSLFSRIESDSFPNPNKKPFIRSLQLSVKKSLSLLKRALSKRMESGAPFILCIIPAIMCFFCSDYAIDSVALATLCVAFAFSIILFFIYKFPFPSKGMKAKDYFTSLVETPFIVAVITAIGFVATFLYVHDFSTPYGLVRTLMIVGTGFTLSQIVSFKEFQTIFRRIMPVVCVISLVLYLTILISGYSFLNQTSGIYGVFYYIFFTSKTSFTRNYGMFWEPGIFSSFILFGLIMETAFENKPDWKRILIYSITIISTNSLAGILLLPLVLLILAIKHFPSRKWVMAPLSIGLVLFVIYAFWWQMYPTLSALIPQLFAKGTSLYTRLFAFQLSFEIYSNSPIFGVGNMYGTYFNTLVTNGAYGDFVDSTVSTTGYLISVYGLLGIFLFFVFCLSTITINKKDFAIGGMILIVTFLIINKEPHVMSTLSWTLFYYLISEGIQKTIVEPKHGSFGFHNGHSLYTIIAIKREKVVSDKI